MDLEALLRRYGVSYATSDHSRNTAPGWVGVRCPFCDDHGDHLGINLETGACNCWRCGGKPLRKTVGKLTGLNGKQLDDAIAQYAGGRSRKRKAPEAKVETRAFKLPSNTGEMGKAHKRYLTKRGFDPEELEQVWGLDGTGPVSLLDGMSFAHRILIPVYWGGRMVSFQARDITGKSELRYISCPKDRERAHHKDILYGLQEQWDADCGICVEGVTDAWRLGPLAFATFGTSVTHAQLLLLARAFRRVAIVFDGGEGAARERADALVARLRGVFVSAKRVDIQGDPGELSDAEARELVADLRRVAI